jgi:hypothetical protein
MNYLASILFVLFSFTLFCKEKGTSPFYKIESEHFDETIPKDKFKISGIVYSGNGENKEILGFAKISTSNFHGTFTDFDGKFELLISDSATFIEISFVGIETVKLDFSKFKNRKQYVLSIYCLESQIITLKPIIYAYSEKEIDAKVELNYKGNLTFTYPQILNNCWEFKTKNDGNLSDKKGKNYPYLFYEGTLSEKLKFSQEKGRYFGNIVEKDSIINFLEKTLTDLALNEKEKTDFITFWGPRMSSHEFVFVQFLIDEEYDRIATLKIDPKPDNLRRIYLVFSEISDANSIHFERQKFYSFKRSGFTVLEWGGSELFCPRLAGSRFN